jgi:hypothetical protein
MEHLGLEGKSKSYQFTLIQIIDELRKLVPPGTEKKDTHSPGMP